MAKRFTKPSINWTELHKKVPAEQKAQFMAFKAKSDTYLRRVLSLPSEPPKINWEEYKKLVTNEKVVDKFKSAYEGFKVPYPEDKLSAEIDEQWKSLEPQIKEYCTQIQRDIDATQKELDRIKALPKFDDMTMETFYDLHQDIALDPVKKPSFWPHNAEEQPGYLTPEQKALKEGKQKH